MIKIEGAIIAVGLLMLQRIPKGILVQEGTLHDQYDNALEEFKVDVKNKLGHEFEPPNGFRQAVIDHLTRFLEEKELLK